MYPATPVYIQTKYRFCFLHRSHFWTNGRLNPITWLLASAVSQLLLWQLSGQNYFGEENRAQQACFLSYCSVGCFAERKEAKWNKSQKGPSYYIIDIKELLRIKKAPAEDSDYFEEWNGWNKKWNLCGGEGEHRDCTWQGKTHFPWMSFILTSGQCQLFCLIRNVTLMFIRSKTLKQSYKS